MADGTQEICRAGNGRVIINNHYAPVIGRVCMDQLAVDITDAGDVCVGDTVTLIGSEKDCKLSAPDVATALEVSVMNCYAELRPDNSSCFSFYSFKGIVNMSYNSASFRR